MMKKLISLAFALVLLAAAPAQASQDKYIFDPVHTQIGFSVSHVGFSNSHGRFGKFSGSFIFDQSSPEASQAKITIFTHSLDMGDDDWSGHVKGPNYLNTEQFPTITFQSTRVSVTGGRSADLTGDLTILGVTKPVTLRVIFNKAGNFPGSEEYKAGFSLTGSLKRSDFGMTAYIPMVGDEITLSIQVEGFRQGPAQPGL